MQKYRYIKAAIVGFFMAFIAAAPSMLSAETLRVLRGDITAAISVPIGGTVLIKPSTRFAEVAIANPKIADISIPSSGLIEVVGIDLGRATLTVLDWNGDLLSNAEILVVQTLPEFDESTPVRLPDMLPAETIPVSDGAASATITLRSSEAVIVESDVPFDDIKIGNQDIAGADRFPNGIIYLLGKDAGRTTLTLLRNDGQPATIIQVRVLPNIEELG